VRLKGWGRGTWDGCEFTFSWVLPGPGQDGDIDGWAALAILDGGVGEKKECILNLLFWQRIFVRGHGVMGTLARVHTFDVLIPRIPR
jgi:hypothetical protein